MLHGAVVMHGGMLHRGDGELGGSMLLLQRWVNFASFINKFSEYAKGDRVDVSGENNQRGT